MDELIPEFERDDKLDYLYVLKSLNEIPFPIGRLLLGDFLAGDRSHKSIIKNSLDMKYNFGALKFLTKGEILEMIDNLISNKFVDMSPAMFNKFIKVLAISEKGQNELMHPSFAEKKFSIGEIEEGTRISENDKIVFGMYADFLEKYNSLQKKTIVSSRKNILCVAGAGSGKTTVLTKRIEFLTKFKGAEPSKILAITFTRKAKEEMKKRLKVLGVAANVETFNSFCEKILIRNSNLIYNRKVRIAGYQDKMLAVISALENSGIKLEDAIERYFSEHQKKIKTRAQLQSIFMNDCFSVLDYFKLKGLKDFTGDFQGKDYSTAKMMHGIVGFLEKHMELQGLRTYADQLNDAMRFFEENLEMIPKYDHILVDEFQDVNFSQVKLIDLLQPANLFCVGDPRQSIFGWRGSDINYILDFKDKYNAEVINLKKNYRSNKHVVDLMNRAIGSMKMTDLEANFEKDKQLNLYKFDSEATEYEFIARKILSLEIAYEEVFVLARTNKQLDNLSRVFAKNRIPFILKTDDRQNVEVQEGAVTLSTIHAIKGLESEVVFVSGCSVSNFPCKASEHPIMELVKMYEYDKDEEERRLFYVAISRAKNVLYLTYNKKQTYFINPEMKELMDEVEF
jgi:superfamily I DNA/RNA helicase